MKLRSDISKYELNRNSKLNDKAIKSICYKHYFEIIRMRCHHYFIIIKFSQAVLHTRTNFLE